MVYSKGEQLTQYSSTIHSATWVWPILNMVTTPCIYSVGRPDFSLHFTGWLAGHTLSLFPGLCVWVYKSLWTRLVIHVTKLICTTPSNHIPVAILPTCMGLSCSAQKQLNIVYWCERNEKILLRGRAVTMITQEWNYTPTAQNVIPYNYAQTRNGIFY